MTKDDAIKKLADINGGDKEIAHTVADGVLLDFLRDNGFVSVADAWEAVDKRSGGFWYA